MTARVMLILLYFFCLTTGCKSKFYFEDDFAAVPKIDAHIHINSDDGVFEKQAAADNFILISLNVDHGDSLDVREQFDYASESARRHPGRVFFGTTFLFDTAGWGSEEWSGKIIAQLGKDLSAPGVVTVKLWKNIGMAVRSRSGRFIMADDPGLDPVINYIKSMGFPVTGHLGEPRNCWLPAGQMTVTSDSSYFARNPQYHMYLHPDYPSYEDHLRARDRLLEKNPDLIFIGAHLGSMEWSVDTLAERLDRYPNMAVDLSARICHLQHQSVNERKKVRDFFIKYQDRLIYGTDVGYSGSRNPDAFMERMHKTWRDDWRYFTGSLQLSSDKFRGIFAGIKLPRKVVDKIYYQNAVKWYKLMI